MVLFQLFYPNDKLLPNTTIGNVKLGGFSKDKAIIKLDEAYKETKVPIYISDSDLVAVQPTLNDLGFDVKNSERVKNYSYSFLARIVPYSIFWYQAIMPKGEPEVLTSDEVLTSYTVNRFGENCEFQPVNATISYVNGKLEVQEAARGGSCDYSELLTKLRAVIASLNQEKITINGTSSAPEISTETAEAEYNRLSKILNNDIKFTVDGKSKPIKASLVTQWIKYSSADGKLTLQLDSKKATSWLWGQYGDEFTVVPGVSTVTLKDYAEETRVDGKKGKKLNTELTIEELAKQLQGKQKSSKLVVDTIEPSADYKRTYSPSNAELSAVIKKYATSHSGTYGVKMVELSGQRRNAAYNSSRVFSTASTYKMFVAYSVLLRIESGDISWTDSSYGGYTVSTCFDKMLKLSDNECAVDLLLGIGYDKVTADAHAIGATNTNFNLSKGISSTPNDEAHLLSLLYSNQLLNQQSSRNRFIETMKGNVYVAGIPTGIPNVEIADKVGFMDGLLHDAAIVYSPKGTYVLIIMTDNASWADIAALAKDIEAAR